MYTPPLFAETREELHRFILDHPLGVLVTHSTSGLDANPLSFCLHEGSGSWGALLAHVARANPVWNRVGDGDQVLVIFGGAGSISPAWHSAEHAGDGHALSGNHAAVHAYGRIRVYDDETYVRSVLARLAGAHPAGGLRSLETFDAPPGDVADELRQEVGLHVELTRLEVKRTLTQKCDITDPTGSMRASEEAGCDALVTAMKRRSEHASRCPEAAASGNARWL